MQMDSWFKTRHTVDNNYSESNLKIINRTLMKKQVIKIFCGLMCLIVVATGCYKMQKDYDYKKVTIDPHYNMTAKQYLFSRDTFAVGGINDTILRWMRKGIEYAGIDWAEYEK